MGWPRLGCPRAWPPRHLRLRGRRHASRRCGSRCHWPRTTSRPRMAGRGGVRPARIGARRVARGPTHPAGRAGWPMRTRRAGPRPCPRRAAEEAIRPMSVPCDSVGHDRHGLHWPATSMGAGWRAGRRHGRSSSCAGGQESRDPHSGVGTRPARAAGASQRHLRKGAAVACRQMRRGLGGSSGTSTTGLACTSSRGACSTARR